MKTIEQENVQSSSLRKLQISDNDSFFDDYSFSNNFSMNRNSSSSGYGKGLDSLLENNSSSRDQWVVVDDFPEKPKSSSSNRAGISIS